MAASAVGFTDGGISVHQTLGVRADDQGNSGMPPTRRGTDPNTSGRE
jgi:cyclopropane-fatty-acyl-phospholipid synthase